MKRGLLVGIGLIVVVVFVALLVFGSFVSAKNQMATKDEAVKASWSEIDNMLARRSELIPNLVATVKGYATHEETVFADVSNANAGLLNAHDPKAKIQASGQVDGAIGRLLALSENYPDLKANQNFMSLQDQLEGSQNRIAVARNRYNRTLQDYNTFIRQFPNSIWAGIAGYHTNDAYFQATAESRSNPVVKF
jgi:LemA protein